MDKDPKNLSDEELDKLIAGEDQPDESQGEELDKELDPDKQPPAEDEQEEKPEPKEPTGNEEEEKPPSRREQLRINKLLERMKSEREEPEQKAPKATGINYGEELNADPEIIKRLEEDRQKASEASWKQARESFQRDLQSSEWRTMLNYDAPAIESRYEILNPKDEEHFHPAVADALTKQYLAMVGYDDKTKTVERPDIRWSDFIESTMELAEEIAASKVATATKSIKSTAANTAIRPDGSTSKKLNLNQAPEAMSDEELDAIIAQSIPKR